MSKGNSALKVLRTALKRVDKGWTKGVWSDKGNDGVQYVCLEGALFGYCDSHRNGLGLTDAQEKAREVVLKIIRERHNQWSIPSFNDAPERTKEEIQEVIKLSIIRLETDGDGEMEDEDVADLLEFMERS